MHYLLLLLIALLPTPASAGGFVYDYQCWVPANLVKARPNYYEYQWPFEMENIVGHELHWRPYIPVGSPRPQPEWRAYKPNYLGCSGQILIPPGPNEFRWRFVYNDGGFSPFSNIRIVEIIGNYQELGCEGCAPFDLVPGPPRNIIILIKEVEL